VCLPLWRNWLSHGMRQDWSDDIDSPGFNIRAGTMI